MKLVSKAFWLPKAGNSAAEYEDAFWPPEPTVEGERLRCAIADGATETSFSGLWASLLVRAFCQRTSTRALRDSLPALGACWLRQAAAKPLPWYAEEKLQSGAFSSLLGLSVLPRPKNGMMSWHALAVGDSCLFQIRAGAVVEAFPYQHSAAFSNRPFLLSSTMSQNGSLEAHLKFRSGACLPGDTLYLMTDALACWFLRRQEEDGTAALCLSDVQSDSVFRSLVEEARAERLEDGQFSLRNDDVTLLRIDLLPNPGS